MAFNACCVFIAVLGPPCGPVTARNLWRTRLQASEDAFDVILEIWNMPAITFTWLCGIDRYCSCVDYSSRLSVSIWNNRFVGLYLRRNTLHALQGAVCLLCWLFSAFSYNNSINNVGASSEAELVRPPARSESASSSSSGFPWRYSVLTRFFCTTVSLNVMIQTSSLSRLLILTFFLSFNPWDLYYQGYF